MTQRDRKDGLGSLVWRTLRTPVPPDRHYYMALGWLVLALFAMQVVTGILLSVYYEATPEQATESIRLIMRNVSYGWLIRGVHQWSTAAILLFGTLPLVRIFVTAAYRREGKSGWQLAVAFLLLLFAFAVTGQLLPWDDKAYWTAQITLESIVAIPVIGPATGSFLSGSGVAAGQTLRRMHAIHVLILPWISFLIVVAHLWLLVQGPPVREVDER